MNLNQFYFCYSKQLSNYLQERGIRYLFMAREARTNALFSLYEKNADLSKALTEYKLIK